MTDSHTPDPLGRAADASKKFTAIVGAASGLTGVLVGALGFAFYVRDEWKIWGDIKSAHLSSQNSYEHKDLESRIGALETQLPLFVTIADLPQKLDDQKVVRFGVPLYVVTEYNSPTNVLLGDTGNSTALWGNRSDPKYQAANQWYLEKSN